MPRKLSPSGEQFLIDTLGEDVARPMIQGINTWEPPAVHNHRCNEPPVGNCGPFLRDLLGDDEGNRLRDAINRDSERFNMAKNQRAERQALSFPSRARPITPQRLESIRNGNAERQRKYRERLRQAQAARTEARDEQ